MKSEKIKQIKEAYLYLDSFIECETENKARCTECDNEILATSVVPFNEAIKALELLKSALDF